MSSTNDSVSPSGLLDSVIEFSVIAWIEVLLAVTPAVLVVVTVWIALTVYRRARNYRIKKLTLPEGQPSQENYIRCLSGIQVLLSNTLPCLQHAIDTWHHQAKLRLPPCSTPHLCQLNKKPSSKNNSCQQCIDWAQAIEAEVYPSTAKGSLQWMNANPSLFSKDPMEVMKLFVLRMPSNKTVSTLSDFDSASILMIMAKFSDFHQGNRTVFDEITKVSTIRNSLAHLRLKSNLDLNEKTFRTYWRDITGLVNCLQGLGRQYFTHHTAKEIHAELFEILMQPVSTDKKEVMKTVNDHLSDFMKNWSDKTSSTDEPLDLATCQKQLKDIYRVRRSGIGFLPGFPKEFSSDEFFVELKLVEQQKTPMEVRHIELNTYTDLLRLHNQQNKSLHHVLISGLAGSGKTTLLCRLAYEWATQKSGPLDLESHQSPQESFSPLSEFELVFVLDIRKFRPDLDSIDAIQDQLLQYVSKNALEQYISTNADKCLVLLDGYDELTSDEMVLSCNLLCGCHVIVTTRPNKVDEFCDKQQGYVKVLLKGFSEDSVQQFVKAFVGGSDRKTEKRASQILQGIRKSQTIETLSHFPLLLAMMCLIWKEEKFLPNTMSSLYRKVIEYLARHWKAREPSLKLLSFTQFKQHVALDEVLIQLGKLAFEGLVDKNSRLIFQEDEFNSSDEVEKGYCLGLITKTDRISGFDKAIDVEFIHKTFQEFCAALYLHTLIDKDKQLFDSYLSNMNFENMEYVLKFGCGASENTAKHILSYVVDVSCASKQQLEIEPSSDFGVGSFDHDRDQWRLPLILLFETESQFGFNESLNSLLKPLVSSMTLSTDEIFEAEYKSILEHYATECKPQSGWISFVEVATVYVSAFDIEQLIARMVASMPSLHTLNVSSLFEEDDCSSFLIAIQNNMTSNLLQALNVDNCVCDIAPIQRIVDHQQKLTTLRSIPFPKTGLIDIEAVEHILQTLSARSGSVEKLSLKDCDSKQCVPYVCENFSKLEKLELIQTSLTQTNCELLFTAVIAAVSNEASKCPLVTLPLKHLDLQSNQIGDSAYKLADAMVYLVSIEYLDLSDTHLIEKHFKVLGPALSYLPKLGILVLSNNRIGNSLAAITQGIRCFRPITSNMPSSEDLKQDDIKSHDAKAHSVPVQHIPPLRRLDLPNANIGSIGAKTLSVSLQYIPNLVCLKLCENNIGSDGVKALSSSLRFIPKLRWLKLSENNIGANGAKTLSESLKFTPKLTRLALSNNSIGLEGIIAISESLQYVTDLKQLDLPGNNIGSDGTEVLSSSLQCVTKLISLDLINNNIGPSGAKALSVSLQHIPDLMWLYMSKNDIGVDGAKVVSESLGYISKLGRLKLSENSIGPDGAEFLSESLNNIPELQWLDLSKNNIGPDGVTALSATLEYIPKLEQLDLSDNNIGPDGAESLSAYLQCIPQLKELNLSNNNIESEGAEVLSESLHHISELRELDLSNNNISSYGARILSAFLANIPKLTNINLKENPIGTEGIVEIFTNLPNVPNLKVLSLEKLFGPPNEQCDMFKALACIGVLQQSEKWIGNSAKYWFDMVLGPDEIRSVVRVVK